VSRPAVAIVVVEVEVPVVDGCSIGRTVVVTVGGAAA